jgi:hypothetical protein
MTQKGWMPIYRRLQDHWLWQDKPFAKGQAWLDLLLLASHNENEFLFGNQIVKNEVGGFITSELKLADRWGWGRKKVRLFLELLQNEQMIVKKGDNKKTAITIVNYSVYADYETAKEQQKNNKGTSEEHQRNTINNDNNYNNDNKYIYIKDIYNEICVSFPRLTVLSDRRKKAIKARLNTYTVEQIKEVFTKAEASDFLKGKNNRNWSANFDWLMNDANMAKILDGNYDNRKVGVNGIAIKKEKSDLEGVF